MNSETSPDPSYVPDAETIADATSLDYKHRTTTDPAHHLQTKSGATIGAIVGAGIGTIVAGPLGAAIGAAVGVTAGALGGKIGGQMFDPSAEAEHWMKHHGSQNYVKPETTYADYEPAYRTGYNNFTPGESFEQAEADLRRYYEETGGQSRLAWEEAHPAIRAAWDRMSYIFPIEKQNQF